MGTNTARDGAGRIDLLMLGMDVASERACLDRLHAIARLPDGSIASTADFSHCTLLLAHVDSPMLPVARRMAATRDGMPLWTVDAGNGIRDARGRQLDDATIRTTLAALAGAAHTTAPAPPPLAQTLRDQALAADGRAMLLLDGQPLLRLDFQRGLADPVAATQERAIELAADGFDRLQVLGLQAASGNDRLPFPLTTLLWNTALRARLPTPLLAPLSPDTVLSLRRWPDFRALAHRHDHFRLCCLLLKRPASPTDAAALLALDGASVDPFFNAAFLSGYADVVDAPALPQLAAARTGQRGSMLARLWQSVRHGLQAAP